MGAVIGYVGVLALWWQPRLSKPFTFASCIVWILLACYVANLADSFQVTALLLIHVQ